MNEHSIGNQKPVMNEHPEAKDQRLINDKPVTGADQTRGTDQARGADQAMLGDQACTDQARGADQAMLGDQACTDQARGADQARGTDQARSADQEEAFVRHEADAWFDRNKGIILEAASIDHPVIAAMIASHLPQAGEFIDLGGGSGKVAAGISRLHPDWIGTVLEPSQKAVLAGAQAFPGVHFTCGSLARKDDMPNKLYDMAIICGVFTWIDRRLLSQAIANVDALVKPGGYVIVSDFDTPYPRANDYHHKAGLFTFKQDYAAPFLSLNIYTQIYRQSSPMGGQENDHKQDPYNAWWMTAVLQKDLFGRYRRDPKPQ